MKSLILMVKIILFGYGISAAANPDLKIDVVNIKFMTKEELEILGVLPLEVNLWNKRGQMRSLQPGEQVQVFTHEEDNSISFTTFDDYSFRVMGSDIQTPRNIGGSDRRK